MRAVIGTDGVVPERTWEPRHAALRRSCVAAFFVACFALTGCGCSPKIKSFSVQPQGYCSTTKKIHIAWSTAHGDTTIKVDPPDIAPRRVKDEGTLDVDPNPMTITLNVVDGDRHDGRPVNVRPVDKHALNGRTEDCTAGWVATGPFQFGGGPNAFDPTARVSVIVNKCPPGADAHASCRRKIQVAHGGVTWNVEPDSILDVSASGAVPSGDWVLKGQLLSDEQCRTPSAASADELALSIEMNCGAGS